MPGSASKGLNPGYGALSPPSEEETNRSSGQILDPIDYSGFIGRNPGSKNVYVATGDSGQGITHGVVASLLMSDLITKGGSPWEELYDPRARLSLRSRISLRKMSRR